MTLLFDHFENNDEVAVKPTLSATSSVIFQDHSVNESRFESIGGTTSGGGIFSIDKVQFNFPSNKIIDFAVENNILVVACGSGKGQILWIDLDKPNSIIEIPTAGIGMIESIFLSPLAESLIISLATGENFFCYPPSGAASNTTPASATFGIGSSKPKPISKIKEKICAVAWPSASLRGSILIGTKSGAVFDLEVTSIDSKKIEKSCVQVFSGHDEICGIQYSYLPCGLVVYIATLTLLYQFIGPRDTVSAGSILVDPSKADVQDVPGGHSLSCMILYSPNPSSTYLPTSLSWLTTPGIYTASVLSGNNVPLKSPGDSTLDQIVIIPYPSINGHEIPIKSMAVLQYHYILLGDKECIVVNKLNHQMQYTLSIPLSQNEQTLGIVCDSIRKTYWVSTNQNLYEIIVMDEDRDIWKIYFDRKQFKEAMAVAKTGESKGFIAEHYATQSLQNGEYELAADLYARTKLGIEEVALRLLRLKLDTCKPLLTFLTKRMALFREHEDKSQTIMIGAWVLELLLSELDLVSDNRRLVEQNGDLQKESERLSKEITSIMDSIYSLMKTYKNRLHSPTIYSLLKQHGNQDLELYYAETIHDYSRICEIHLSNQSWLKALEVIGTQSTPMLLYKHSPVLILSIPLEVVRLWKRCGPRFVNPRLLLPSMLCYEIKQRQNSSSSLCDVDGGKNEIILYLEYVIHETKCTDRVIHNYLLYLYVTRSLRKEEKEKIVIDFIKRQTSRSRLYGRNHQVWFDIQYALRICQQYHLLQSCVQLYLILEMQKEAVALALKSKNIELAKEIVEQIEEEEDQHDQELKNQLWLQIVQYVITECNDIKRAMVLGKEGNLKLEQILSLFPDFVEISQIKNELLETLQTFRNSLEYLSRELDESATSSDLIRNDIRALKGRSVVLPILKKCDWCKRGVLTRQFHVFPCHHAFHSDCIVSELMHYPPKSVKVKYLQSQISETNPKAKEELERIVGEECILCSDIMIRTIDIPLVENIDKL